ncbi:MAG: L,D-transpeptidase [Cyanobacteria bacterium TMED229]|jgi:hypothetical protein|nr:MAG: L,D-transpeptidase [Cyanobacteria bacterium TMED229]
MRAAVLTAFAVMIPAMISCKPATSTKVASETQSAQSTSIQIQLDVKQPEKSMGILSGGSDNLAFTVGYGKYGIACEDSAFSEGLTPVGTFRVNAILGVDRFDMDPALIKKSGKSKDYLKANLFSNMNSIDFKGDGEVGEYGDGYISLEPVSTTPQPFSFNDYAGTFRWYSFAIHGTNNDQRVGQKVTGGCLNVAQKDLETLMKTIKLGDEVTITANGPCQKS